MVMCCEIFKLSHNAWANFDVKRGLRSDMMLSGSPKKGNIFSPYSFATPSASIVLLHGRKIAALLQSWSTTVRIESNPSEFGKSVMRSMLMCWNGAAFCSVGMGCMGAFGLAVFGLLLWHTAHPLT